MIIIKKSPENDGLSKELYECFCDEIKESFLASIHKGFSSQKQPVIKMLEKRLRKEIH